MGGLLLLYPHYLKYEPTCINDDSTIFNISKVQLGTKTSLHRSDSQAELHCLCAHNASELNHLPTGPGNSVESKVNVHLTLTCNKTDPWPSKKWWSESVQALASCPIFQAENRHFPKHGQLHNPRCCTADPNRSLAARSRDRDRPRGSRCSEGIGSHGRSASRHIQALAPPQKKIRTGAHTDAFSQI